MVLSVADWVGKLKVNILLVLVFHGICLKLILMWIKVQKKEATENTFMMGIREWYINNITNGDLQGIQLDQVNHCLPVQEHIRHHYMACHPW